MLQQYISSGRNLRKNLGQKEAIYAQADLLPNLKQVKADTKYKEDELTLAKEGLAADAANADRSFDLSVKSLKQSEEATKRSNLLGVGKLGLDTYLGYKANADTPSSMITGAGGKTGVTKSAGEFLTPSPSTEDGGVFGTITGAIKDRPIGTGLGAVAGYAAKDWLADATGMDEGTASVVAPVAGAVVGNVVSNYAAPVVNNLWSTVGSWFGF